MCQAAGNPVQRRELRRLSVFVSVSLVGYIASSQASLRFHAGFAGMAFAALSGLFFFAELVSAALLVYRRFDEFQRMLLLRSFLWAIVITMGLTVIWGFTELHLHDNGPHMPLLAVPAILILLTAAAKLLIFRQHRSSHD